MTEVKGVGRRTHFLDYFRNRRYWELKRKQKIEKEGNESLSILSIFVLPTVFLGTFNSLAYKICLGFGVSSLKVHMSLSGVQ